MDEEDVTVVANPLAQDCLTDLRSVETDDAAFRGRLNDLGRVCGVALADRLPAETVDVTTPLAETTGTRVRSEDVALVSVLRAATPFVAGLVESLPRARQGVLSASRDESRRLEDGSFPVEVEYVKLPDVDGDTVVVADPMLATGSTMVAALEAVDEAGDPDEVLALSAVSAPAGIERVREAFPEVEVATVAVDDRLDENGYIVPGLGDAGDRAFGTEGE
ncbi:uracil phosphoribosyltransferase [Salinirussus salinus]|jgi:uracil phosphoribosyltransferase|uniref:uracil phosphoribosyltransferase n=1 Tax=Salinirussus salinus TaxID=1198300 RepID=UPI00135BF4CF|nr:uracil phosphoribosyltransferase [Salinirussus salinus]